MKHLYLLAGLYLISAVTTYGQSGKVFDNLSMSSDILQMDRKYAIYLPPDYETSTRSYPVLYLLHGSGDDQSAWIQYGEVMSTTDDAIRNKTATPMIIVMPDANTRHKGYFNTVDGSWRYEDFFFEELIPHIEETYRVRTDRYNRAIAGLSMGGGGTYMYALHKPHMFAAVCPLSGATGLGYADLEDFKRHLPADFYGLTDAELGDYLNDHNVLQLIEHSAIDSLKLMEWYIDCGDEDILYEGNSYVHISFRQKDIPHEYRVRDGKHDWTYWREALPAVLKFVSDEFHQI